MEREEVVQITGDQQRVADEIVAWSSRKRLSQPLYLLLEMHFPLHNLAHNLLVFSAPWIQLLVGTTRAKQLLNLSSSKVALSYLREQLAQAVLGQKGEYMRGDGSGRS